MYTNRHIFFLIRSHGVAGARSRADTAWLHPRRRRRPLPPRHRSLDGDVHISRSCCCFSSRSRCCSTLALGPLPGLLLLLLLLALLLSLLLLLAMLLRFSYTSLRCRRGEGRTSRNGEGARRRGNPLSILGFRMGTV